MSDEKKYGGYTLAQIKQTNAYRHERFVVDIVIEIERLNTALAAQQKTLLDEFAMAALTGLCANAAVVFSPSDTTDVCPYKIAKVCMRRRALPENKL